MSIKLKATTFRIEWHDGSVYSAEGDAAAQIVEWLVSGERLSRPYREPYAGPTCDVTLAK